jgi:hypothetical protein
MPIPFLGFSGCNKMLSQPENNAKSFLLQLWRGYI